MGQRIKVEYVFLIYSLVFGLLLVILSPPLQVPDEQTHFVYAYSISKGDFWGEVVDGRYIRRLPKETKDYFDKYAFRFVSNYDDKMDYYELVEEKDKDVSNSENTAYWDGPIISPLCYFVPASGMFLGSCMARLGGERLYSTIASPYNQMLLGRLTNLLFYVFLIFAAIRTIPFFKRTMLLLAMMPMSIFLGASLNYDAIIIPVTFLFISIVMRLITERNNVITTSEIITVLFCVFFMVAIKVVYTALLLMLFTVPKKKYGGTRKMILCIAVAVFVAIFAYIPQLIVQRLNSLTDPSDNVTILDAQMKWMKQNIFKLPGIIIHTILEDKGAYLEQFWGRLGWLDTPLPKPLVVFGLLVVAVTSIIEMCSSPVFSNDEWWKRLLPLTGAVIAVAGFMLYMYWTETPLAYASGIVGGDKVLCVQGRYFIPVFLPVCIAFSNKLNSTTIWRKYLKEEYSKRACARLNYLVYLWSLLCGIITVLFIFLRYWA